MKETRETPFGKLLLGEVWSPPLYSRELESGLVVSLPGTESTGFSRAGDLVRRVMTALADRDQREDGQDEDLH